MYKLSPNKIQIDISKEKERLMVQVKIYYLVLTCEFCFSTGKKIGQDTLVLVS